VATKPNSKYLNNNPNLPMEIDINWTAEMINEFRKCQEDIIYFAENYFFIINLDRGQEKIKLYEPQKEAILKVIDNRFTIGCASRQVGKRLALDTPIPTPNGWTTMGELKDGDIIFDWTGKPTKVVKAHEIRDDRKCFEITFSTGEKIIADAEHEWFTQHRSERAKGLSGSVKTSQQIFDTLSTGKKTIEPNHRIPIKHEAQYEEKELPIDPYLLGCWLGDGASAGQRITSGASDAHEMFYENLAHISNKHLLPHSNRNIFAISILKNTNGKSFVSSLKENNLFKNKHIPNSYLQSSTTQREELLKGLMDTDGYCNTKGVCQYYTIYEKFAENVKELLFSLGIQCSVTSKIPKIKGKEYNRIYILTFKTNKPVFKLKRKLERQQLSTTDFAESRNKFIYIKEMKEVASVPTRCITVDNEDQMYLIGKTFIPTHNTTLMTVVCLWYTLFFKTFNVAILANKEAQAKEILERIKNAYEEIPEWLKSGVKEFTKEQILFANKSKIFVSTTSIDAIRGKSVNLLFLDEFAHVRDEIADDFFKAIMPTISSSETSKLVIVSTPKGITNRFYTIFSNAELNSTKNKETANEEEEEKEGDGLEDIVEWAYFRIYWWQLPGRDEKWKQKQLVLINHDMELWKQEYDIEFLKYGASALNGDIIAKLKKMCCPPKYELFEGDYKIWFEPIEGHIYVFGIDTAQGVAQDYSVCHILDMTDLKDIKVVARYASNRLSPTVFAERIFNVIPAWGRPFLCVESNKEGMEFLNAIMEVHKYDNIIYYNMENDKRGYYQKPGIFCHQNSKYTGITNMKHWVETMEAVSVYDIETVKEFETFIRKENKTWAAQKGCRDDKVMALVWALIILEPKIASRYFDVIDYDDFGMPERIRDPNYAQALEAFQRSNRGRNIMESAYSDPAAVLFDIQMTPNLRFGEVDVEVEGLMAGGWRIL